MAKYFNIIDALEAVEELLDRKLCCIAEAIGGADQDDDVPSLEVIQSILTATQAVITAKGHTWGASDTLPTPQAIVFKNFASDGVGAVDVDIPASLWWKAEVKLGNGITSAGGNTLDEFELAGAEPRVDGQAHLPVTLTIPNAPVDTVVLRVNYEPIA